MKTYLNVVRLRFHHGERYRAHQQIDTLMQEKMQLRSGYSWRIVPFPTSLEHSLVQIRTAIPLSMPGEVQEEILLKDGDIVTFQCAFNSEIREFVAAINRKVARFGTDEEVQRKFAYVASQSGLTLLGMEQIEESQFVIKKPKTKQFTLGHRHYSVTAKLIDATAFEIAFTEGLGKKRMFGFGFIENLGVI
jgi:hypothetical protein